MYGFGRGLLRAAAVLLFFFNVGLVTAWAADDVSIDTSAADSRCIIAVQYKPRLTADVKVMITKDSDQYVYTIKDNNPTYIPLQLGNGSYSVQVLQNVSGTKYKALTSATVAVSHFDETKVYVNSIQIVNFNSNMDAIKAMNALADKSKSTGEKIDAIYSYIIGNISYDTALAQNLPKDYIPAIDTVYDTKKGICYGYAALFASALRDLGVPAKLEMGYCSQIKEYHAWNEILVDGKWIKVDTTYDAAAQKAKVKFSMAKDNKDYSVVKYY